MTGHAFDEGRLRHAFDRIGRAALGAGAQMDIALYGGAALMLASNFRFATEDADIAEIGKPWPEWLRQEVADIASSEGWQPDWLNDAVQFHLSPLADQAADHLPFGSFPRDGEPGLRVFVPAAPYLLALKLKAMRINDPARGAQETSDIQNLLHVCGVAGIDEAIAILARYFPRSAIDADKQRFFLKHIWPQEPPRDDPPRYPVRDR